MLKKLLVFAITSGLAAKLYQRYTEKQAASRPTAAPGSKPVARKRTAQKQA
jgi:Tfp pilus assembly major pilin PilA